MPVLVKLRAHELDAAAADASIASARDRVVALLKPDSAGGVAVMAPAQRDSFAGMHGNSAMDVLARRLNHIEHAAEKVARLAARPVIEDV
jgi:hypothetical protein